MTGMTDGFRVDPAVLSGVTQEIANAVEELGPAVTGPMVPPAQSVGHDGLAQALEMLGKSAQTGVEHLIADGRQFHGGLSECQTAYQRQEQKIYRAMSGPGAS